MTLTYPQETGTYPGFPPDLPDRNSPDNDCSMTGISPTYKLPCTGQNSPLGPLDQNWCHIYMKTVLTNRFFSSNPSPQQPGLPPPRVREISLTEARAMLQKEVNRGATDAQEMLSLIERLLENDANERSNTVHTRTDP